MLRVSALIRQGTIRGWAFRLFQEEQMRKDETLEALTAKERKAKLQASYRALSADDLAALKARSAAFKAETEAKASQVVEAAKAKFAERCNITAFGMFAREQMRSPTMASLANAEDREARLLEIFKTLPQPVRDRLEQVAQSEREHRMKAFVQKLQTKQLKKATQKKTKRAKKKPSAKKTQKKKKAVKTATKTKKSRTVKPKIVPAPTPPTPEFVAEQMADAAVAALPDEARDAVIGARWDELYAAQHPAPAAPIKKSKKKKVKAAKKTVDKKAAAVVPVKPAKVARLPKLSAYALFMQSEMKKLDDSVQHLDRMKEVGARWAALSAGEKAAYQTMADAANAQRMSAVVEAAAAEATAELLADDGPAPETTQNTTEAAAPSPPKKEETEAPPAVQTPEAVKTETTVAPEAVAAEPAPTPKKEEEVPKAVPAAPTPPPPAPDTPAAATNPATPTPAAAPAAPVAAPAPDTATVKTSPKKKKRSKKKVAKQVATADASTAANTAANTTSSTTAPPTNGNADATATPNPAGTTVL